MLIFKVFEVGSWVLVVFNVFSVVFAGFSGLRNKCKKNDFSRLRGQNSAFMAQIEANGLGHDEEHILMSQIQE